MDMKPMHSFSQDWTFKLFANHIDKVFYAILITCILFTYNDLKGQFLVSALFIFLILISIILVFSSFLSKFIWKIIVNFENETLTFFICRKNNPIKIKFKELDGIKVCGPIVFNLKDRNLYYSTKEYNEVLSILQKVRKIKWGKMCNLLGPDRLIREIIDGE